MKTPSVLLLAGTLLVAGSAALLARALLTPAAAPTKVAEAPAPVAQPKPSYPAVLVAARDIKPGDFIDPSMLHWQPSEHEQDGQLYFLQNEAQPQSLTGATVRQVITADTPLTSNLIVKANEPGFIATVIKPGMRALAIPTSNSASLYSMISLGDRVDVIVNLQPSDGQDSLDPQAAPRLAAQTLLQGVRVLSINNRIRSPLQPMGEAPGKNTKKDPNAYPDSYPEVVTLEVPPAYAERLALASQIGTLQLALRSSLEPDAQNLRPGNGHVTTLAQTTQVYEASSSTTPSVKIYRGDATSATQFDAR